ncbi:MAG: FtsX-like permease family protein [Burkholderiaceae bacterium]
MTFARLLQQAARMTRRDWHAGELRLLLAALVVAVAAVTSVGFLVDRIRLGLERDATQLLGADLVLSADQAIGPEPAQQAQAAGLLTAETTTFPSMALAANEGNALVAVKAVSSRYPLRGRMRLTTPGGDEAAPAAPAPGAAWADPQLLAALGIQPGESIQLGDSSFVIERVISVEPDRGSGFINFAPRVMINLADLPATGLIQPGSRATYRLLVAGERGPMASYSAWLKARLARGQSIETLASGRPEMQRTIERAQQFLSLVAMLAAMVAAVAVAASARRFSARHLDSCAMMRCLGLAQADIVALFALEFLLVGLAACALGVAVGYALHFVLLSVLGTLVASSLPPPSALPALQGLACGMVLLAGFALPPLAQLRRVPPLRVLRKDLGPPAGLAAVGYLAGLAGFFGLMIWAADDLKVGLLTAGGFAVALLVFALVAWLAIQSLAPLRQPAGRISLALRFAVASVQRRPLATVIQLVALAVGLMALLLLAVTRTDLVDAWRRAAPPDAPNRFVINIQPDQVKAVEARLAAAGIKNAPLYPMVRGRLVAVNGAVVGPETFTNERAQRLVDREFNLSYMNERPGHNPILAGQWFGPQATDELSIEEGIAKTLGLKLGDALQFEIAGRKLEARITSLRKVNWDSMRANFFVIMPPALLADQPASFITAFYLSGKEAAFTSELLREFPSLTVVDTSAVLRQIQAVLDQVIAAVEFLFLFTLAAGVLVLYAALASSRDERMREAALLRALGASRRQLAATQVVEMLALGALAGLLAAVGAAAVGWALARFAFEFDYALKPAVFLIGLAAGSLIALAGGWMGLRGVLNTPPLASLRQQA